MTRAVFPLLNVTLPHYNLMQRMFKAGWSARKVANYMTGNGMGYRWTTILATRRKVLGLVKKEHLFKTWTPDKVMHKGYYEEIEFGAPFKYRINYFVDVTDSITGIKETVPRTGLFDTFIDPDQIVAEIQLRHIPERYFQYSTFTNVQIRNVQHQAGAPY